MVLNIITPIEDKKSSFRYVTYSVINLLKDKKINVIDRKKNVDMLKHKVKVHEFDSSMLIDTTFNGIALKIKADIWWTDEPMLIPNRPNSQFNAEGLYKYFLAVSKHYADHIKKHLNIKASDIVYRPYNPVAENFIQSYDKKEYDIIYIGVDSSKNRKRADYVAEYLYKHQDVKGIMVTDYLVLKHSNIRVIDIGSLDENEKFDLISKSKFMVFPSEAETFGLPVLEAMAVGTIPIFPDTPPFTEYATGLSFKALCEKIAFRYGCKIVSYELSKSSLFETIDYALGLSKEEYENISTECIQDAREINFTVKNKLLEYIDKIEVV